VDGEGNIRGWNPAAERILGVPAASLSGASVRQFCPTIKIFVGMQQALGVRPSTVRVLAARARTVMREGMGER